MMGITQAEVMAMPMHDYEAAIYHWNRQHEGEDEEPEPLSADDFLAMQADIEIRGIGKPH